MRSLVIYFSLILGAALASAATENSDSTTWEEVLETTHLLSQEGSAQVPISLDYLEKQIKRTLSTEQRQLLTRDASGPWKTYEDDLIRFELPEDPQLTIKALKAEEPAQLQVVGGVVSDVDNRYDTVYKITIGDDIPYGLILVTHATWFDEGICFCGAIALKQFTIADGNLIEFSQLASGKIKKAQVINDTHRAMLFEWTHSAITQDAYARIAASIRLKPSSTKAQSAWRAFTQEKRGDLAAGTGWLRLGMSQAEMIELLPAPTSSTDDQIIYRSDMRNDDGSGSTTQNTFVFSNDRLQPLAPGWSTWEELEPTYGSMAWVKATLRNWREAAEDLPDETFPSLPKNEVDDILNAFLQNAPTAEDYEWNSWCYAITALARLGSFHPDAIDLIAQRSVEPYLNHNETRWAFELYDHPSNQQFTKDRIQFFLDSNGPNIQRLQDSEMHNLYANLDRGQETTYELIRTGLAHANSETRADAIYWLNRLPKEEGREALRVGLKDSEPDVQRVATFRIDDLCTADDLPWLSKLMEEETDEFIRNELKDAIAEIKN